MNMKRLVCFLLALAMLGGMMVCAASPVPPPIDAPSGILIEQKTGTVLHEKDADARRSPASVTKIMTLLLTVEAIEHGTLTLEDKVTISRNAMRMGGSTAYLAEGEVYTVHELLKAVSVASANDGAVALAEHLAGSEESFVARMNGRATELGMQNTHFVNCHGLDDPDHYTTARDIALMSRALLEHDLIRSYTTIWMDSLRDGTFTLSNTNRMIRYYTGTTGVKTGSTSIAKNCLSASALRDGMELIAIVLGADTSDLRYDSARKLLDFGFANYQLVAVFPEEVLQPIPVVLGKSGEVQPVLQSDESIVVEKGSAGGLVKTVALAEKVHAPVEAGQKLGELVVSSGDDVRATVPIVAGEAIPKLSYWDILGGLLKTLLMID